MSISSLYLGRGRGSGWWWCTGSPQMISSTLVFLISNKKKEPSNKQEKKGALGNHGKVWQIASSDQIDRRSACRKNDWVWPLLGEPLVGYLAVFILVLSRGWLGVAKYCTMYNVPCTMYNVDNWGRCLWWLLGIPGSRPCLGKKNGDKYAASKKIRTSWEKANKKGGNDPS